MNRDRESRIESHGAKLIHEAIIVISFSMRFFIIGIFVLFSMAAPESGFSAERPNIVYILADDMGYGDISSFNEDGKISTPKIDLLAGQGMRFTDAHAPASVCTPTRYGIITGRHPMRTRTKSSVVNGLAPLVIEPDRMTVAELLKQSGYDTAIIGKWHLGLDWGQKPEKERRNTISLPIEAVDFTLPIPGGPCSEGFDRFFGIAASLDMYPYVFIENDRIVEPLTEIKSNFPERPGPAGKSFEPVDVLPTLTRQAVEWIERYGENGSKKGTSFFLYLPLNAPHTPLVPTAEWRGRSELGDYGDFCLQVDDTVGRIMDALERCGLTEQTIVVFTSDNGFASILKPEKFEAKGHYPSYVFRGYKSNIYEGGHRIPFIVRWPGTVESGTRCDRLVCLSDFMGTCAEILGATLSEDAAEDSFSFLPLLRGETSKANRSEHISIAPNDSISFRSEQWKLIVPADTRFPSRVSAKRNTPLKKQREAAIELFDLRHDPGESVNLAEKEKKRVESLVEKLERIIEAGRSTPGALQKNDSNIRLLL